ncbi:MAG TPA: hypothetical protein VFS43_30540 [Polyangiaceae bacterium]|nr:hypothetical protein [Polyangiaceae bacterium]
MAASPSPAALALTKPRSGPLAAVGGFFGDVFGALGSAAKATGRWVADRAERVGVAVSEVVLGAVDGVHAIGRDLWNGVRGKDRESTLRAVVTAPFHAGWYGALKGVSALQTVVGLEPKGRAATNGEAALARSVFGPSLDLSKVRIKEGSAGLFSLTSERPFNFGSTLYLKKTPANELNQHTLIHELVHSWQHQHGGPGYALRSAVAQGRGTESAYDWKAAAHARVPWSKMNPEQQAKLIEDAVKAGFFAGMMRPGGEVTKKEGEAPFVVSRRLPSGATETKDYTAYLKACLEEMRHGRGA